MGQVITATAGTVQASNNGGGLAIYIDNATNEVMLKDIYGNVEPLSNFIKNNSEINENENESSGFYLVSIKENNILDGKESVILSGEFNVNRGEHSVLLGGEGNTTANKNTFVGGGKGNTVDADFGLIVGGSGNIVNGKFSSVLAGENNNIQKHKNAHIIGSNITADSDDTTFVEILSIKNMPKSPKGLKVGTLWSDKGLVRIVE
jgi:hypothetical protein